MDERPEYLVLNNHPPTLHLAATNTLRLWDPHLLAQEGL